MNDELNDELLQDSEMAGGKSEDSVSRSSGGKSAKSMSYESKMNAKKQTSNKIVKDKHISNDPIEI